MSVTRKLAQQRIVCELEHLIRHCEVRAEECLFEGDAVSKIEFEGYIKTYVDMYEKLKDMQ